VQQAYIDRFPEEAGLLSFADFIFLRGDVTRIRWIGGFAQAAWIDQKKFEQISFDPIAYQGSGVMAHMNEFHTDALRDYLKGLKNIDSQGAKVEMTDLNCRGFSIGVTSGGSKQNVRFDFPTVLVDPADVRSTMIDMLKAARA
jgi:hypothetical protein